MPGAIMQIVARNSILDPTSITGLTTIPQIISNENNFAHEPLYNDFQGTGLIRTLDIPRSGDIWYPEYICVEQSNGDTEIKIKSISIGYNSTNTIFDIDIDFMKQLYPDFVTIRGNKIVYKLNMQYFMNNNSFRYVGITSTFKVNINLHNETNISHIKLMSDYTYLDSTIRNTISNIDAINSLIKENRTIESNVNTPYVSFISKMFGYTKGFFIETDSGINNIKNLTIKLNGHPRFELDDIQIEQLTHKINDNMFYLSLIPGESLTEFNINGGLQLDCIDVIEYIFEGYNNFSGKIKVHTSVFNVLSVGIINTDKLMNIFQPNLINVRTTPPPPPPPRIINTYSTTSIPIQMTKINKIYTGDEFCVISLEEIETDMEYMECNGCTKVFIKEYIEQWFANSKTCPHCRITWTSNNIFINKDDNTDTNIDNPEVLIDNCIDIIDTSNIISGMGGLVFSN
jgi:hypothetical protein